MEKFKLSKKFIEKYEHKKAPFGFNGLGELVYMRTYSRIKSDGKNEQWFETVERVVNGAYNMQKVHIEKHGLGWDAAHAQKSAQEMYDRIFNFKFLPPGRSLFFQGTPALEEKGLYAGLNNCFRYETKILTRHGYKEIGSIVNTKQVILTKNGKWVESTIKSFGKQKLDKIVISRQGIKNTIYATSDHIWFAKSPSEINHNKGFKEYKTQDLKQDYRLQYAFGESPKNCSPQGIQHGVCFGDGTKDHLYLFGKKQKLIKYFNNEIIEHTSKLRLSHLPEHYKILPNIGWDKKYLYGWLKGYFATDGSVSKRGVVAISSSKKENLEFFRDVCAICGIGTYSIRLSSTTSNFKKSRKLYQIILMRDTLNIDFFLLSHHKNNFKECNKVYWFVESVEKTNILEEVYCAIVPKTNSFVIEGNILTHNCGFVSTENLKDDLAKPFCFLMDMSMLGCGIGFDTKGAGAINIKGPNKNRNTEIYIIPDSREGWVESVKMLIESYFLGTAPVEFDYSQIREPGLPIKGFGGMSSGPEPLKVLHDDIKSILNKEIGSPISLTSIVDIQNAIGRCVIAGNIRRTAEIVFGDPNSDEYLDLKNYDINPQRQSWGWASNNSIFAELGMDYSKVCKRTQINGEPGFAWLENMRGFSRMKNNPDYKDARAKGGNPCLEQTLNTYELCCLVETFPNHHDSLEDFQRTLKFAYLYGKTVTLGNTHWAETNRVLLRNRRIGCSVSGIAQFITNHGIHELQRWLEKGYDEIQKWDKVYSDWLAIPLSIKTTSVKPSGSVSLLAGATPGVHYPESRFYIRRMRIDKKSTLLKPLEKAGYHIEEDKRDSSSMVVDIPIDIGKGIRELHEVSMWEQLALAAFMQRYWADNQVSCTVTFDPDTEGPQLQHALDYYQYQLKGISFLPRMPKGAYEQMPYESISEDKYKEMKNKLKAINFTKVENEKAEVERFCNNDTCEIPVS